MKLPKRIVYKKIGETIFTKEYICRIGICQAMLGEKNASIIIDGSVSYGLSAKNSRELKKKIRKEFEKLGVNFLDEVRKK